MLNKIIAFFFSFSLGAQEGGDCLHRQDRWHPGLCEEVKIQNMSRKKMMFFFFSLYLVLIFSCSAALLRVQMKKEKKEKKNRHLIQEEGRCINFFFVR